MEWSDPAAMTDREIESELSDVAVKLTQAIEAGGKIGELEARQWRLRAEQTFRQRTMPVIAQSEWDESNSGEQGE